LTMGCGQVVRHQVLVLAFGGSNPSIPAKHLLHTKNSLAETKSNLDLAKANFIVKVAKYFR
jgi:hypothetical protein